MNAILRFVRSAGLHCASDRSGNPLTVALVNRRKELFKREPIGHIRERQSEYFRQRPINHQTI